MIVRYSYAILCVVCVLRSVGRSMFTIFRLETGDTWDQVMLLNVFGCDKYPSGYAAAYTRMEGGNSGNLASTSECMDPRALGWLAVPIFLTINILGAYVMPTILIGIVVVSFDEATSHDAVASSMMEKMHVTVASVKETMPEFFTQWRIDRMLEAFQEIDADGELTLDMDEMAPFFGYVFYSIFDVELSKEQEDMLYQIMDVDADADLGFPEFVTFLAVRCTAQFLRD